METISSVSNQRSAHIMESVKAVVEELKCLRGNSLVAANPDSRFCGGCCEGTVFTFTSSASNGRSSQRLRCRATTMKPVRRKEEAMDSVFCEMRMMPQSREKLSADGEVLCSTEDFMLALSNDACKRRGADFLSQNCNGAAQNPLDRKQLSRRGGSGECNLAEEELAAPLKQPEILEGEPQAVKYLIDETHNDSHRNCEAITNQVWRSGEKKSAGAGHGHLDPNFPKARTQVQYTEPYIDDRKDERNLKRYSSGGQTNTSHQRKLRRAREREEELFPTRIESTCNDFECKIGQFQDRQPELKLAGLAENEGRLQIAAELRNLQARQHVTGLKWNMIRGGQASLSEQAHNVVKDLDSGGRSQTTMEVVSGTEDHVKENGQCSTTVPGVDSRRPAQFSPSNGPLACSFISFKGGVSRLQGKTFSFGGEAFTRAESSGNKNEGTVTCMTTGSSTKSFCYESVTAKSMEARNLVKEISRSQSEISFGCISTFSVDREIKTSATLEAVTTTNGDTTVPLGIAVQGHEPVVMQDATGKETSGRSLINFSDCETMTSSNGSHKLSSSEQSHSLLRERKEHSTESKANGSICTERGGNWSAFLGNYADGERFRGDHANTNERRPEQWGQRGPPVNDTLTSISLDWYGPQRNEDCCVGNQTHYFQNHWKEADCSPRSSSYSYDAHESNESDTTVSIDGTFGHWKDLEEGPEGTEKLKEDCEFKMCKVSDLGELHENTHVAAAFKGRPFSENMHSIDQFETRNQEEAGVHGEACHLKSHRRQLGRKCEFACSNRQDGLLVRPHAWNRSFKKTAERVSYFEKRTGRGKRKASLKKRFSNVGGTKNGVYRLDKPQHGLSLGLQAEGLLDTSHGLGAGGVTSPTSLKNGHEAYHDRKRVGTLDAIVGSDLCRMIDESSFLDSLSGESNKFEVFVSSSRVELETCNDGRPILLPERSQAVGNGGASSSQNLGRKWPPDFSNPNAEGNLTDRQFVGSEVKCAVGAEFSAGKVETPDVPTPTNISTYQGSEVTRNGRVSHAFSSHGDGTTLIERKYEVITTCNKELKSFGAQEPRDCVDARPTPSSCGHRDSLQDGSIEFSPVTQALTGAVCDRFLLQKSVSDNEMPEDSCRGDAADATKASTSAISSEESTIPSVLIVKCPDEASEEEKQESRSLQYKACDTSESQQSSSMSSLAVEFADKPFSTDRADWALVDAADQESFGISEESRTDDIQKPVISRKQKTPIVVRVRNGLASGWLLQNFIWKKFGKQKAKTVELQSPPFKEVSRKENVEPPCASSARLSNTHSLGALTATLNSSTQRSNVKAVFSLYQPTARGDKTAHARQKVAEGVATSRITSSEIVLSATVRVTPGSENTSVNERCHDSEHSRSKSDAASAFECSPDGAIRKILPESECLTSSEARISDASVVSANLGQIDLKQQSSFGEDTLAREPETWGNINKDDRFREEKKLTGTSPKIPVRSEGESQSSHPVASVAVCPHEIGSVSSEASLKCLGNGIVPVVVSNEDASSPNQFPGSFNGVSESFLEQKKHQDIELNHSTSVDHSVGRASGGPKERGTVLKSRCELSCELKKRSPVRLVSGLSADAHGEDQGLQRRPVTLDPPLSGDAEALWFTESRTTERNPYKRLSGLLTRIATTEDVPTSSQKSSTFAKCKELSPRILRSENVYSWSLQHSSFPTTCENRLQSIGEKRDKKFTILREYNNLPKSKASFDFAGFPQSAATEKSSEGASKVSQCITSHTGSKPWSSPLAEGNAFHVPETVDAPEMYNDTVVTGQPEVLKEAISFEAQSVSSPPRNNESKTHPGKGEDCTSSVSHEIPWILEEQFDGRETETGANIRMDMASSSCQSGNQNSSDFKSLGISAPTKTFLRKQPDEHSDVQAIPEMGRAGSWLHQGQVPDWCAKGPTGEKGNANMEGTTDAAPFPAGFCYSHSLEWNGTDNRETHESSSTLDLLGTCANRFVHPISSYEAQSSKAPTFQTPLNSLRLNDCEALQPQQEVEQLRPPLSSDFHAHDHGVRKDELQQISFTDGHTQDEVFLERFSSGKGSQSNKMQDRRTSSVDFSPSVLRSLKAPTVSTATSMRRERESSPSQDQTVPTGQNSRTFLFNGKVEPSVPGTSNSLFPLPGAESPALDATQTILPSTSNLDTCRKPLQYDAERAIPRSNITHDQVHHAYETGLLRDFHNSFSSVTPCSSMNGYSENSDKISLKPSLCLHGSAGYDPGVAWGHYSDEALDFKAFPAHSCIQSMPVLSPPSLVQNPSLILKPQTFRSSCHNAQPFHDPCNYNSFCPNSSCNNQFPVRGPMLHQAQYHCGSEHALGHHIPAFLSALPTETAITQHMRVPVSHGYVGQYGPKVGRYTPPQTMPTCQSSWPTLDKNIALNMSSDTGIPGCNSALGKEQDSGLVWLTGEEVNLIRELRQSGGKDSTRSLEPFPEPERNTIMSSSSTAGLREGFHAGGSNISHGGSRSRCSNYSSCTSPQQINEGGTTTHMKAASIIQRAWRALLRRRQKPPTIKALPKNMEDFYELIKTKHSFKNYRVPSFENFVRSIKYIQATTEGARVRRRLKSRRLQAIIMEIKEIRNLLSEMSEEANRDASAPYLYQQLCNQLQQKIVQFHAALTGPQTQARFLLRGPATPLVLYPSKSSAASSLNAVSSHKAGDQRHLWMLTAFAETKTLPTQPVRSRRQGSKGKVRPSAVKSEISLADPPESAKLLPWYFLAQRTPSKPSIGRSSPTEFTSSFHVSRINKKESEETILNSSSSRIVNKGMIQYQQVPLKTGTAESSINEIYEEQPLSLMQTRKTSDLSFDEIPIGTANAGMFNVDFGPTVDLSNKPKRPFLKRKSIVMAPQKLDWSKVKPMVSSRLEPELKTKLSYCRHTKAVDRPSVTSTSRRKKENYGQVKSRLFTYEENLSPSSLKGNALRSRHNEQDDAASSPRSRGGSIVEGISESGESSRLEDYRRTASPDLLRLKTQVQADTEAELAYHRVQASITDPVIEPTYSSRFDSARYLHKLENSEQAAQDSSMQAAQPRTQRIRLRLIPGSEENEPGRVLVQKIENQEEEMPDLWHDQRVAMRNRRRQSHSHRYASYRESSQGEAQQPNKLDESRRPTSSPDRRTVKAFSSSKMGLASKELEEMFERVITAKCGRNITLSDLFEQTQDIELITLNFAQFFYAAVEEKADSEFPSCFPAVKSEARITPMIDRPGYNEHVRNGSSFGRIGPCTVDEKGYLQIWSESFSSLLSSVEESSVVAASEPIPDSSNLKANLKANC